MTARKAIAAAAALAAALAACTFRPENPGEGDAPPAARRGGTLVVAVADDAGIMDPQLASQPDGFALIRATQRGLMAFPATADADPVTPVPDLASGPPETSADGLVVTFTLRAGAAFGPPASRPLTSADVKAGIERAVRAGSAIAPALRILSGAAEFVAGTADTIAGIETPAERTIRFRLTAPANDLAWILAHPSAAAVPAGTPPAVPPTDLSASGPYRVERAVPGREILLVRNPAWTAGSDPVRGAYVDEIAVRVGASDTADLTGDDVPPPAGAEVRAVDAGCLLFLFIRPEGRFAERDARAAVSIAVDRAALAAAVSRAVPGFTAIPTLSVLPSFIAGAVKRSVPPGDAAEARRLLGGPADLPLGRETVGPDAPADAALAGALAAQLAPAGIRVTAVRAAAPASIYDRYERGEAPAGLARWCPDWPGRGVRTMVGALAGTGGVANYSGIADPALDQAVADALSPSDPARIAAATTAAADRALSVAALVPLAFLPEQVAVSGRIRGFTAHPLYVRGDPTNVWLAPPAPSPETAPASPRAPGGASSNAFRYTFRVPTTNGGAS